MRVRRKLAAIGLSGFIAVAGVACGEDEPGTVEETETEQVTETEEVETEVTETVPPTETETETDTEVVETETEVDTETETEFGGTDGDEELGDEEEDGVG